MLCNVRNWDSFVKYANNLERITNNTFTKRNIFLFTSHVTEVCFSGGKRSGCGVDHASPSRAKVKERVEIYLYSPHGPSWLVIGELRPLLWRWIGRDFLHSGRWANFYWGISSCKWILKSDVLLYVPHNFIILLEYRTLKCKWVLLHWGWVCSGSQAGQCERHWPPELDTV